MNLGGYTAEVTNLSPIATEKDVHDFFALCGKIDHIEIVRAGELASTAYVTFTSLHALEIAELFSGAIIVDQPVCIARWGHYEDENDNWKQLSWKPAEETIDDSTEHHRKEEFKDVPSAGEIVRIAEDVVKTMISKGYVVGKDALDRARAFDESHQLSAKLSEGMELVGSNFLKGAVLVSGVLCDAAEVAVDLGSQGINE